MRGAGGRVVAALAISIGASLGLAVVYGSGGHAPIEGALLALALGGLGAALVLWANRVLPSEEAEEERLPLASPEAEREALEPHVEADPQRRRLLGWLVATISALGLAALFPLRSLGPAPQRALFVTGWREGRRLMTESDRPVRAGDLEVGGVLTVWPEGHVGDADSPTLLIRVDSRFRPLASREDWAPDGHVAYSKICTHAGCPVGLYQRDLGRLLCPCHQSTFDVMAGANPVFGPAVEPLPQLPLRIDSDGYLRATGEFSAPTGPGFWERNA